MWTNKKQDKYKKLSRELLSLLGLSFLISAVFYTLISLIVRSIAFTFYRRQGFSSVTAALQINDILPWSRSIILVASVFLFVFLFLFFTGQKLLYLEEIIRGVEMLRANHMAHSVPIEGNNDLTRLAESINYLARVERELKEKEAAMQQEREALIRSLSHDIRTPLTSIMSYTEYLSRNSSAYPSEIKEYLALMSKKGAQIKLLTTQLLERSERELLYIQDGRCLIEQLACDFEELLGDDYCCDIDIHACPTFQGEYCIQDFQRISDNLISNIRKYADESSPVFLQVYSQNNRLVLKQGNEIKAEASPVESYKIGLESIRRIAREMGGDIQVNLSDNKFEIIITLFSL